MTIDFFTFVTEGSAGYAEFLKISASEFASGNHNIRWACVDSGADSLPAGYECVGKASKTETSYDSYNHAEAIHEAIKHVESEYVVFIDADVALFYEGWDDLVVERLNEVSFFGLEYGREDKYADFPCLIMFCFKKDMIDKMDMDFYPQLSKNDERNKLKKHIVSEDEQRLFNKDKGKEIRLDVGWKIPVEANRKGYRSEVIKRAYPPQQVVSDRQEWHYDGKPFASHLKGSRNNAFISEMTKEWRISVSDYVANNHSKKDISDSSYVNKKETYRTNYVIASWHGKRSLKRGKPRSNSYFDTYNKHMIELHIEALSKLKTNLDQITIAVPSGEETDEYFDYLVYLHSIKEVNGVPVEVMFRKNKHLSYGGWADAVLQNDDFDYHIFIEDDYVPVRDNFDSILVDLFRESCLNGANCGFMCGLNTHKGNDHAAISNGITSSAVLSKTNKRKWSGQMEFSRSFQKAGFYIDDWRGHYRSPYYTTANSPIKEFAPNQSDYLIVPYQLLEASQKMECHG